MFAAFVIFSSFFASFRCSLKNDSKFFFCSCTTLSQIAQNQIYPPGAFKILESIENTPSIALELLDLGVGTQRNLTINLLKSFHQGDVTSTIQ